MPQSGGMQTDVHRTLAARLAMVTIQCPASQQQQEIHTAVPSIDRLKVLLNSNLLS